MIETYNYMSPNLRNQFKSALAEEWSRLNMIWRPELIEGDRIIYIRSCNWSKETIGLICGQLQTVKLTCKLILLCDFPWPQIENPVLIGPAQKLSNLNMI